MRLSHPGCEECHKVELADCYDFFEIRLDNEDLDIPEDSEWDVYLRDKSGNIYLATDQIADGHLVTVNLSDFKKYNRETATFDDPDPELILEHPSGSWEMFVISADRNEFTDYGYIDYDYRAGILAIGGHSFDSPADCILFSTFHQAR